MCGLLRAIYELLLSEGGANAQSIREKIAPVPADLQSGVRIVNLRLLNELLTGSAPYSLPTMLSSERIISRLGFSEDIWKRRGNGHGTVKSAFKLLKRSRRGAPKSGSAVSPTGTCVPKRLAQPKPSPLTHDGYSLRYVSSFRVSTCLGSAPNVRAEAEYYSALYPDGD